MTVTDIDGTLYSYGEWVLSQNLFLYREILNPSPFSPESTDRVFKKYFLHIQERVRGLNRICGKNRLIFYSGYPLTDTKKKLFKACSLPVYSSFPKKKSGRELKALFPHQRVLMVIGDRLQDRRLALSLRALWKGYRFYEWPHLLTGRAYTRAFFRLVSISPGEKEKPV